MPYSTACTTPLSNFESNLNYKDVSDPSVYVTFPLVTQPDVSMMAWTTTPWTLPSNLCLTVHPEFKYLHVREKSTGKQFIIAECRMEEVFKPPKKPSDPKLYDVVAEMMGKDLKVPPRGSFLGSLVLQLPSERGAYGAL